MPSPCTDKEPFCLVLYQKTPAISAQPLLYRSSFP
ncbi:unnamed protein product [Ectocarpus sp. 8 AP-2014]